MDNNTILLSCHTYVNQADIPTNIKIIIGSQIFVLPEDCGYII